MKKVYLLLLVSFVAFSVLAQDSTIQPVAPYLKTKTIPSFKLMVLPDSTLFKSENLQKGEKTILIYFGADCGHCMSFAKKLMDSISSIKNTQIVMVSSSEYSHIKKFTEDYNMGSCPFMTVGRDADFFFITHFEVRQFPSAYVYDTKGKFVAHYEGDIDIVQLANAK